MLGREKAERERHALGERGKGEGWAERGGRGSETRAGRKTGARERDWG